MIKQILNNAFNSEAAKFAMKPHFLASCAAFAAAALLWHFSSDFINLHIFWFLDLAMGAAYCGFLFTALPAWQGFGGSLRGANCALFALLALSAASASFLPRLAAALALVFWLALLCTVAFIALKTRSASFLQVILLALLCAKFAYFFTADLRFAQAQILLNAAAVHFISFRISAAICRSALDEMGLFSAIFIPSAPAKNLAVMACCAAAASCFASEAVQQFALLAAGFFSLARTADFASATLLKTPYIAGFALLLLLISAGFFAAAYAGTAGLHFLAIFSICGMIFAVFCIAGRRHFGLPLRFGKLTAFSIACLIASAVFRGFLLGPDPFAASAWLLSAAFAAEFVQLLQIMRRQRFLADA